MSTTALVEQMISHEIGQIYSFANKKRLIKNKKGALMKIQAENKRSRKKTKHNEIHATALHTTNI